MGLKLEAHDQSIASIIHLRFFGHAPVPILAADADHLLKVLKGQHKDTDDVTSIDHDGVVRDAPERLAGQTRSRGVAE